VYDIPSMQRTSRGRSIANLVRMQSNETYKAMVPVRQFEEKFVMFATTKGTIKKTALGAFSHPRPSGIIAIGLDPDDALIGAEITSGQDQIVLATRDGQAVRFNETDVRAMGRGAHGVKGADLRGDDVVVDMVVVRPGMSVLTVCENGYGKRTDIDEYRLTRRGSKGVINIKTTDRNGKVVSVKAVQDDDELMLITAKGIMIRTDLAEVREIGRATQGVRLMRLEEGDKVVAVARLAREDVADTGPTAPETPDAEAPKPTADQESTAESADNAITDEEPPPAAEAEGAEGSEPQ